MPKSKSTTRREETLVREQPLNKSERSKQSPALLRLTLPLPPSINEQYATVNGHRVSTAVARRFKQHVRETLHTLEKQGILDNTLRDQLRQNYVALFLDFYFMTPL